MKKLAKLIATLLVLLIPFSFVGCSSSTSGSTTGSEIIDAKQALGLVGKDKVVLVDMQQSGAYVDNHMDGAVNISLNDIVINTPFPNMLAPKDKIENTLGRAGISNDTTVLVYDDNNNMDAARFWWTLKVYGHENVKVVSGGLKALKASGGKTSSDAPSVTQAKYTAKDANTSMIATIDEVKAQVNNPDKKVVLLDTRSQKEFDEGTIPTSILIEYLENNYKDGTYKSVQDIKIMYLEKKIKPENTVIMYCKTSIRGAETYLALYNAGYRNLKLYDGAWVEWSADKSNPVQTPAGSKAVAPGKSDNS